jgi:hypothetical protein
LIVANEVTAKSVGGNNWGNAPASAWAGPQGGYYPWRLMFR